MQEEQTSTVSALAERRESWQTAAGGHLALSHRPAVRPEASTPSVAVDRGPALTHAKGMEMIAREHLRVQMTDRDREQVLQVMEEGSSPGPEEVV